MDDCRVTFTNQIERYARYDIGDWTYGEPEVIDWEDATRLRIGRFCSIAAGVTILLGGEHRTDWVTTYPFNPIFPEADAFTGHPRSKGDIVIGHDVWLARGATILSGVAIGNGAVIGAGSVVARDVAPYSIVAGNPARFVRSRFDADVIDALQAIAWWDWPIERVKAAFPLLLSRGMDAFIRQYQSPSAARQR